MANKWKYSTLPASERLGMVRGGNKDVYDNEIARSMDVIKQKKALGLDVSDQKDWIDKVSYNYNLHLANGIASPSSVNKTGYADRLLGEYVAPKKEKRQRIVNVNTSLNEKIKYANQYLDEYYDKVEKAEKGREAVKEWLINNGIDENSVDGKKYLDDFDAELKTLSEKYMKEYISKIKAL